MPNSHSVPREPFAAYHATIAAVRAEQEAHTRWVDDVVVQQGRAIVIERVRELRAREFYEGGWTR